MLTATSTVASAATLDPEFGSGGTVSAGVLETYLAVEVDSAGRTLAVGTFSGHLAIARLGTNGSPDTSFSGDGRADLTLPAVSAEVVDVRVLGDGSIVTAGSRRTTSNPFSNGLFGAKVDGNGVPVSGYGTAGVAIYEQGYTAYAGKGAIAPDGGVVISQFGIGGGFANGFSAAGVVDDDIPIETAPVTLPNGCPPGSPFGGPPLDETVSVSQTSFIHVVTVGSFSDAPECVGAYQTLVTRQTTSGAVEWSVPLPAGETSGVDAGNDIGTNPAAIAGADVLIASATSSGQRLHRLSVASGSPVPGWGTSGAVDISPSFPSIGRVVPMADGRIGLVSSATFDSFVLRVDRLTATGATDPTFGRVASTEPVPQTVDAAATSTGAIVVATGASLRRFVGDGISDQPDAIPLEPGRLLDTRPGEPTVDGQFAGIGRAAAGSVTRVRVAGRAGVPADAAAAIVNLTIVSPGGPGFATIYPCTATPPRASNINYLPGAFVANGVTAKLDPSGDVCIYTLAAADIVLDANGYLPAGSGIGTLSPARLLDTRPGEPTVDDQFAGVGRAAAGSVTRVRVAGRAGVPADATAAMVNLTIASPDGPGFATIYPCTPTPPRASNINYAPGSFVANGVTAKLDANGDVCIFTLAAADVIVDAMAYVGAGSTVGTLEPGRLLDTRPGEPTVDGQSAGIGRATAGSVTRVRVAGRAGVPVGSSAAMLNLTIAAPGGPGFATIYPCTPTPPRASNINYLPGQFVANGVTAKLDANGDVCIYTLVAADIVLDANGYVTG